MRADGGILVTPGCSIFADSQSAPPESSCDISSPMNAYSAYYGAYNLSKIYPDPATNFTTLRNDNGFPSPQAVFCGSHQFTVETYFTNLNTTFQGYMILWTFYSASTGQQIAYVRMDSVAGSGRYLQPSTSYTVTYNNGLVSWPVPGQNGLSGSAPEPTISQTSTASEFHVIITTNSTYINAVGATALSARGYFH